MSAPSEATPPALAGARVEDSLPPLTKPPITTRQLVEYAGASGDFNPIHYDDPFARAAGFRSVIAHGMLSMAFLGELVSRWAGGPGAIARLAARFKAVTYPGDTITVTGVVTAKLDDGGVELRLEARNQNGQLTVEGSATVRATSDPGAAGRAAS